MAPAIPGRTKRVTLGMDRGYDGSETIEWRRERNVTPHRAQKRGFDARKIEHLRPHFDDQAGISAAVPASAAFGAPPPD